MIVKASSESSHLVSSKDFLSVGQLQFPLSDHQGVEINLRQDLAAVQGLAKNLPYLLGEYPGCWVNIEM